jgi:CheY-like chemotaxis protein
MESVLSFVQAHKPYFEVAQGLSSVLNLLAWCLAIILLLLALRKSHIESLSLGPFSFRMKQEAVDATATAARAWESEVGGNKVDIPRIRETVDRAFVPTTLDHLIGKSILWVDDNPANNELAVRALRKFHLDVEQVTSTEAALGALQHRKFDLVISDMGRGVDMQAGYRLLKLLRDSGSIVPFFIFAGSDTPEFRRQAAERGAQLSTNDMLELVDNVIKYLGAKP